MHDGDAACGLGEIVEDRLLDGRLILRQPKKGHRAGSDAILLAAALPEMAEGPLLDVGAGVGTVGLAAALLRPALHVVLLERDRDLAALAVENVALNRLEDRARAVAADITGPAGVLDAAGLARASFACVAMNPPFYAAGETVSSPVSNRRAAHVADGTLADWFKAARRLLRPGGTIAIVHRAPVLSEMLQGLETGFGGVTIRPVHGFQDRPAIRVLVTAVLNSRKPAELLPAFVINASDGRLTEASQAVHRGQAMIG